MENNKTSSSSNLLDRMIASFETLAWLHKKDAKNSAIHWDRECTMCATLKGMREDIDQHNLQKE